MLCALAMDYVAKVALVKSLEEVEVELQQAVQGLDAIHCARMRLQRAR